MREPIEVIHESREEFEARQLRDYQGKNTFLENVAIITLIIGVGLIFYNLFVGLVVTILACYWIYRNLRRARARIKTIRRYGKRQLQRARGYKPYRRRIRHRRHRR